GQDEIAVNQYWHLGRRIELEKPGTEVLARRQIDTGGLEVNGQLLEYPASPDRAGGAEFVQLHGQPPVEAGRVPALPPIDARRGPFSKRGATTPWRRAARAAGLGPAALSAAVGHSQPGERVSLRI